MEELTQEYRAQIEALRRELELTRYDRDRYRNNLKEAKEILNTIYNEIIATELISTKVCS